MEMNTMMAKYTETSTKDVRGKDITSKNYKDIIAALRKEEQESHGIMKNEQAIRFLEKWFGR